MMNKANTCLHVLGHPKWMVGFLTLQGILGIMWSPFMLIIHYPFIVSRLHSSLILKAGGPPSRLFIVPTMAYHLTCACDVLFFYIKAAFLQ